MFLNNNARSRDGEFLTVGEGTVCLFEWPFDDRARIRYTGYRSLLLLEWDCVQAQLRSSISWRNSSKQSDPRWSTDWLINSTIDTLKSYTRSRWRNKKRQNCTIFVTITWLHRRNVSIRFIIWTRMPKYLCEKPIVKIEARSLLAERRDIPIFVNSRIQTDRPYST